jgi:tRNA(fMet)-specific endonuclease VapC
MHEKTETASSSVLSTIAGSGCSPRSDQFRIFQIEIKGNLSSDLRSMPGSMRLIDTSICVAILRGKSPRALPRFRAAISSGVAISSITAAELYFGMARCQDRVRESKGLDDLFGAVQILPFGSKAARAFGLIREHLERRGMIIGQFDLLIAAHAISEDATLVTNNTREFSRVPTLTLEDWLQ